MRLAYIDESYDRERFVLAVVIARAADVAAICASLDGEVRWAHRTFGVPLSAEMHAQQVLQGKGEWSALHGDPRVRLRLAHRTLAAIASTHARILVVDAGGAWDRAARPPNAAVAYRWCLDAATRMVEREARLARGHVLVVADEVSGADDYRDDVLLLRRGSPTSERQSRLLDTIYFVPSRSSRMIQAADLVAYLARRVATENHTRPLRRPATALWAAVADRATWMTVPGSASAPVDRG